MQKILGFYKNLFSENSQWFRIVGIWFAVSVVLGAIVSFTNPNLLDYVFQMIREKFGDEPVNDVGDALAIFKNNFRVATITLVGGLLLGLGPFVIVVFDGFIIGYAVARALSISGGNIILISAAVLPHGILEIPAFLLAAALGLRLGTNWLRFEKKWQTFKKDFLTVLIYFPSVALFLLLAAFIEVFVSGAIFRFLSLT